MPFGHHLGSHQNINLARAKIGEDARESSRAARHVAVEARDAGVGEEFRELELDFLRALADVVQVLAPALGTSRGDRRGETAVVADEPVLAAVVGEGDRAIRAAHRLAAAPAQEKPGEAAPVEQDHGLRAGL